MRSKDLFMAATIDPERRIIMVSGAIDQNEVTIVMRIAVPEKGSLDAYQSRGQPNQ